MEQKNYTDTLIKKKIQIEKLQKRYCNSGIEYWIYFKEFAIMIQENVYYELGGQ